VSQAANDDSADFHNLVLHIGIQKTGTTFMQDLVFPRWQGIDYVYTDKVELLLRSSRERPVLLSREGLSGQNWAHHEVREQSIARLAGLFPQARIMLSFRRHARYIVSSYNQFLQRGGCLTFEQYFDPYNDSGFMKIDDFRFALKVDAVERYFQRAPFVFFQEEIGRDLQGLLDDMQDFIGGEAPPAESIRSSKRLNQSVRYHPAKLLRYLNSKSRTELNPAGSWPLYHPRLQQLKLDPRTVCQRWLRFAPDLPLVSAQTCEHIDSLYEQDWNYVNEASARQRASASPAGT